MSQKTLEFAARNFNRFKSDPVLKRRIRLGRELFLKINGMVLEGKLEGYCLNPSPTWGPCDFGVSLVLKGYFKSSACFEIDSVMRRSIKDVAKLNDVEDQVFIFGAANDSSARELEAAGISVTNAVVLCDIEDDEFELLIPLLLDSLKSCSIVVELHEAVIIAGKERLVQLISDAETPFVVSFLDYGVHQLSSHPYVRDLLENDR